MSRSAPPPPNESKRLEVLRSFQVLDSAPEASFDRVTKLAADLLNAPICLISLVDQDRQWFKSRCGLEAEQTPRDDAFCAHAILDDAVFVVEDATRDPRFAENPLVTGPPHIRTYAGAPLITREGYRLGTLCLIYDEVTAVSDVTRARLADFAALAMDELELRRSLMQTEAAHAETQRHRALLESMEQMALIGCWEVDAKTQDIYWSRQTRRIHGVSDDYQPCMDAAINFYHPDARPVVAKAVEQGIATGQPWDLELPFTTATGNHIWVRAFGKPEYKDGELTKLIGAFQDITQRRERDEELRRALAQISGFFDVSLDLLCIADFEGRFVKVNTAFEALLGVPACELVGNEFIQYVHPGDRQATMNAMATLDSGGAVLNFTNRYQDGQGAYRFIEWRARPANGVIYAAARDITERLEREQELERKRAEAEAATHAKSQFLANMSHEIRTPMNAILGMATALARDPLSDKQRRRLDIITQSGDALLHIINDILDLSKIESGRLEIEQAPFDLDELLAAVEALYALKAEEKGLVLSFTATNTEQRFVGDATRIRQVLSNLVSNAIKFTDHGEVAVDVAIAPSAAADANADNADVTLHVTVRDTGPGLTPEAIARLFQPFTQADASITRKHGGTGLGLAICKQLCTLMGGAISVDSTPGHGAVFRFHVRLTPALHSAAARRLDAPEAEPLAAGHDPLRILAAEDNANNVEVLAALLEPLDVVLSIAKNGEEAVAQWRSGHFDLILMDVQMPVMNGIDATHEIRRLEANTGRPRTPIIALSANAMAHQTAAYYEAGMDAAVSKPIRLPVLFAQIAAVLQPEGDGAEPATGRRGDGAV